MLENFLHFENVWQQNAPRIVPSLQHRGGLPSSAAAKSRLPGSACILGHHSRLATHDVSYTACDTEMLFRISRFAERVGCFKLIIQWLKIFRQLEVTFSFHSDYEFLKIFTSRYYTVLYSCLKKKKKKCHYLSYIKGWLKQKIHNNLFFKHFFQ